MGNCFFDSVKKNFGFGFMRLPMKDNEVDYEETIQMVDAFMDSGFNYFDTAHGYLGGKSEIALRECLVKRYPRDTYIVANKLTSNYFEKEEDIAVFSVPNTYANCLVLNVNPGDGQKNEGSRRPRHV